MSAAVPKKNTRGPKADAVKLKKRSDGRRKKPQFARRKTVAYKRLRLASKKKLAAEWKNARERKPNATTKQRPESGPKKNDCCKKPRLGRKKKNAAERKSATALQKRRRVAVLCLTQRLLHRRFGRKSRRFGEIHPLPP
jgi:hypothetical protein